MDKIGSNSERNKVETRTSWSCWHSITFVEARFVCVGMVIMYEQHKFKKEVGKLQLGIFEEPSRLQPADKRAQPDWHFHHDDHVIDLNNLNISLMTKPCANKSKNLKRYLFFRLPTRKKSHQYVYAFVQPNIFISNNSRNNTNCGLTSKWKKALMWTFPILAW